ncbi:MAG: magnesium/cobalt transporter CorA, partial [Candidatus Binatia bacterium]
MKHKHKGRKARMRRRTPPGTPPGTLIVDPEAPQPVIHVVAYGPQDVTEQDLADPRQVRDFLGKWPVTWVNVEGLGNAETISQLGEIFGLHRLALEDVINVHQRAKVEPYGEHYFVVTRMAKLNESLETEQLSLFVGKDFVVTFQEGYPGDCLEPVRERVRHKRGRIRDAGFDYLAYALLDAVVDCYFPVLEEYGERLETLEDAIIAQSDRDTIAHVHAIKRDLLTLRRILWPQREALNALLRDETPLLTPETRLYLRDCYDHTVQLIDLVEAYRELASDLTDIYLSSVSNRTSEIMRVLTVITTIFIPLTFIAGIYGMNFNSEASPWNMPELNWYWGYPFSLALMGVVVVAQLFFFWRKGWLGLPQF